MATLDENWVCVFETTFEPKASLLQSLLKDRDIEAVLLNQKDSSYQTFGNISLFVHRSKLVEAKHIIDKNNS